MVVGMMLQRIDHIGVIVEDLDRAATTFRDALGLTEGDRVERDTLRSVFFDCGGTEIELVEILDPEQRAERLGADQARIEHIAFEVDDLDATYAALGALGIEAKAPPRAAERYRTFFTRADTADGIAYQFVQRTAPADEASLE
jgi:catechol 2,3-dioxygenase-like lactoylglutathione lyase family enzyme